jgi:cell division protein FtsI (penicillin-binding protein 3)
MDEQRYKIKADIVKRIRNLHLLFTGAALGILIYTIVAVTFNDEVAKGFQEVKSASIIKTDTILSHRGTIYGRNGEVLATSITRKTLLIDYGNERFDNYKKYCKNAKTLSVDLANYFGDRTAKSYYDELINYRKMAITRVMDIDTITPKWWQFWKEVRYDTTYKVTKRKHIERRLFRDVDINEWYVIKEFPLLHNGLGITYSTKNSDHRVYPQGALALRTIGRIDKEQPYGIEFAMQDTLEGKHGRQVMQTIAPGYSIRVEDEKNITAIDGYDVVTTLDMNIQDVVNKALSDQLLTQNAIWGTTLVMECATGDILAMVNLKRNGSVCAEEQNYAIGVPVNPGSTFKLISAMALLEHGVPISKEYYCEMGERKAVGGTKADATVIDSHAIGKDNNGYADMRLAFSESSNVYFTKAVFDKFGEEPWVYSDFCRKLHLHEKMGLTELGSRAGRIPNLTPKHHSRFNALVNMAYGYGLEITPLHTLTIYNAIANNGKMVEPRLFLRTERNGEVVSENPVKVIEQQICSPQTISTLRSFMEEASRNGTGKRFFGEKACPFKTGSKTGTAQVETVINDVRYIRSDNFYYGSMVTYLPAEAPRYIVLTAIFTKKQEGKAFYGGDIAGPVQKRVATYLYNRDFENAQTIERGNPQTAGINSKKLNVNKLNSDATRIPDVVGMGLNDALFLLEKCGLVVEVQGQGRVVRQSLEAGSEAKSGKRIKIELQ